MTDDDDRPTVLEVKASGDLTFHIPIGLLESSGGDIHSLIDQQLDGVRYHDIKIDETYRIEKY